MQVTRVWRAFFKLAHTLLLNQAEVNSYIVIHNRNDLKRKRKIDKKTGKMEPNDQVAHPDFGHMEVFHDFLRIWVQFVDRLECCEAMLFEQYMTAKCIQAIDENKFVRPGFDDVKNVIL